jgi:hypothetical protein
MSVLLGDSADRQCDLDRRNGCLRQLAEGRLQANASRTSILFGRAKGEMVLYDSGVAKSKGLNELVNMTKGN